MDKSFMIFLAVGLGFFYLVTTYVSDLQKDDKVFRNSDYDQVHKYDAYKTTDSIGQEILDVTIADPKTQMDAWHHSALKQELLDLYPDFDTMKSFVKNRIRGEYLVKQLTDKITEVEDKFLSGTLNAEQAKRVLERF